MDATEERHFGSSQPCGIQEILPQRLQHICRLEQWKRNLPSACAFTTYAEIAMWSPPSYRSNRFRILLTIHYHVTTLLINQPVLESIAKRELGHDIVHSCTGEISIAMENDFTAARELDRDPVTKLRRIAACTLPVGKASSNCALKKQVSFAYVTATHDCSVCNAQSSMQVSKPIPIAAAYVRCSLPS